MELICQTLRWKEVSRSSWKVTKSIRRTGKNGKGIGLYAYADVVTYIAMNVGMKTLVNARHVQES